VCPKHEKHLKESGPFLTASYNLKKGTFMKKKISFMILLIIFMLSESVFSDNATQQLSQDNGTNFLTDNSTLILYYSMTGKTKIVAEKLNSQMPGSKLVEVKSDASIPAAIFWYKLPFTKAKTEPLGVNFDDYDQIFLCTPIYMQGISPAIKAVIKDIPMKNKKVSVFTTCGGFYGFLMHGFVKRSIKSKGAEVQGLYVVKVGGKSDEEIENQTATHLKTILDAA
jgi:flavodoxin